MRAFFAACLLALALPAAAQVTINAEISKTEPALDDQIALSVTIAGPDANLPEPRLPPFKNLNVYDSGRSQSLSIVNGRVESSVVHTFVVVPSAVGKAVIPPISIIYKGKTLQTEPIELNVRKPGSGMPGAPAMPRRPAAPRGPSAGPAGPGVAPPPAQKPPQPSVPGQRTPDVFVTAELDKKKAFVNEQVTLTVRFFTSVTLLQAPQYQPPSLTGFLAEDLPPERHGTTDVRGRTYYYSEIKTALFPARAGRLEIGAAGVRVVIPTAAPDPFAQDFIERFFQQGMGSEVRLASEPIELTAEALPESGKPAGFSGAVGRFTLSAAVDRAKVKAGEAVNLTVTVSGDGNLKAVGDPAMPELPWARVFETVSSLNMDKKQDAVKGSKVFKTVIVPRVSGAVTIPPITFDYFDPQAKAYKRAASQALTLDVAPGEAGAETAQPSGPGPSAARGVTEVSRDLRYLHTAARRGSLTRALEALAFLGAANAAPFVLFALALGWTQYRQLELADPAGARARAARRAAEARVKAARAAAPERAAAALSEALAGYLGDKLGQPASGLTVRRAQELIRARNAAAPAPLLEELKSVWEELEFQRFAPPAARAAAGDLADRAAALIARLDKEALS